MIVSNYIITLALDSFDEVQNTTPYIIHKSIRKKPKLAGSLEMYSRKVKCATLSFYAKWQVGAALPLQTYLFYVITTILQTIGQVYI